MKGQATDSHESSLATNTVDKQDIIYIIYGGMKQSHFPEKALFTATKIIEAFYRKPS